MSDVTRILSEMSHGDPQAEERLIPLVYDELRGLAAAKLSRERPGQTLQATALVHEAYMRLLGPDGMPSFESRGHFFGAAAEAMRRLLVERARREGAQKRGGDWQQVELADKHLVSTDDPQQVVMLDEALKRLEEEDPDGLQVVKLVLFGGFTVDDAGRLLDMSRATAYRHWAYARAWLIDALADDRTPPKS